MRACRFLSIAICCSLTLPLPAFAEDGAGVSFLLKENNDVVEGQEKLAQRMEGAISMSAHDRASLSALDKELELMELNTRYRLESTKVGPMKPWRQALAAIGQHGTSLGGIITLSSSRWHYWRRPTKAPKFLFETGPMLLLIGHSVGLGGTLLEAGLDAANDHKLKELGLDRKTYLKKVSALKVQIVQAITDRQAALESANLSADQRNMLQAEQQLLTDALQSELSEATRFAVRHKRFLVGRNVSTLMAIGGQTTGGYIGALMSTIAAHKKKPHLAGTAGLGFTLSGAFIVLAPLLARACQNYYGKRCAKENQELIGPLDKDALARFDQHSKMTQGASDTQATLSIAREMLHKQTEMNDKEAKQLKKDWIERVAINAIVGGTKMGYGIQLMNAGWSFPDPRVAKPAIKVPVKVGNKTVQVTVPHSGRINAGQKFNRRIAAGATTFIPGLGVSVLDTLQSRIRGEIKTQKQKREGTLPAVVLKKKLASIAEMRAKIKNQLASAGAVN